MENRSIVYQLAHPHQDFLKNKSKSKPRLNPFPFVITEEAGSQPLLQNQPDNIFRSSFDPPAKRIDGSSTLDYHSVGNKELKSYISKMEKRRRYMNSMVKRSTESNLTISRSSQARVPQ